MLNRKMNFRGFSRVMIGLFAVQVLAAGFCLLTPDTNAQAANMQMPMSGDMMSHCDNTANTEAGHDGACAHCDLPEGLLSSKVSAFDIDIDLPAVVLVSVIIKQPVASTIDLAVRPPTGPPNSSSLLFQTTRRILI